MASFERAQKSRSQAEAVARPRPSPGPLLVDGWESHARLLTLQRVAGNRAVASLLTEQHPERRFGVMSAPTVQRRLNPEDVAGQMVGQHFELTEAFSVGATNVAASDQVVIVDWPNVSNTVRARLAPPAAVVTVFDIPKRILRPVHPAAGGLSQYGRNVGETTSAMEAGQKKIDAELARRGGPRAGELTRLQGLQRKREILLNQKLIQETMFNRFDPAIQTWTAHYNALRAGAPDQLDPNLVKSLLFQESELGTSGRYLGMVEPIRNQFNIGQAIDSSAGELLIMIREMQPTLITKYHLASIETDLENAKKELKKLQRPGHPTAAEQPRHDELVALSQQYWEEFLWTYRAPGKPKGFAEAVDELFKTHAAGASDLNLDYEFWIRTTIRWLFEKRKHTTSWEEAIRAYNGSGAAANAYRDAVTRRASDAATAEAAGTEYIPTH